MYCVILTNTITSPYEMENTLEEGIVFRFARSGGSYGLSIHDWLPAGPTPGAITTGAKYCRILRVGDTVNFITYNDEDRTSQQTNTGSTGFDTQIFRYMYVFAMPGVPPTDTTLVERCGIENIKFASGLPPASTRAVIISTLAFLAAFSTNELSILPK